MKLTMMAMTTTMATGDDNDNGNGMTGDGATGYNDITRAMGDNDYDDDYGNGAAGDEVDDDGDDTDYGNRQ